MFANMKYNTFFCFELIKLNLNIMKKLLLSAAMAVFMLSNVNAQEVKFGVKAGVNFASLGGDDASGFDGLTSFHVGALAEIGISEKFAIQPELVYSLQGASAAGGDFKIKLY